MDEGIEAGALWIFKSLNNNNNNNVGFIERLTVSHDVFPLIQADKLAVNLQECRIVTQ